MVGWSVPLLRVLLVVLFLAVVIAETVVLPMAGGALVEVYPRAGAVRLPVLAVGELVLVSVQVVLACTWSLLSLVQRERIFVAPTAFRRVDSMVAAEAGATLLLGVGQWALMSSDVDLPVLSLALLTAIVFGAGLALLMLVMRALLREAARLRAELAEVV